MEATPSASSSTQHTSTPPFTPSRITKRKLDEAITFLDDAVRVRDDDTEDSAPPKKRPNTATSSFYASLAKYGIKARRSFSSKNPSAFTTLLSRANSLSRNRSASTPLSKTSAQSSTSAPTISLPQPLGPKPSYRPSSTPDFLARLSTFKLTTYRDKPAAIDAVAASKAGWRNDGKDRLVCEHCTASWVVAPFNGLKPDAVRALTERQKGQLVTSHKDSCPWRKRQCDASVYRVPIKGATMLAREVKARASALAPVVLSVSIKHPLTPSQVSNFLGAISSLLPSMPTQTQTHSVVDQPPPRSASPTSTRSAPTSASPVSAIEPSQTALIISLFGWEYVPPPRTTPQPRSLSRGSMYSKRTSLTLNFELGTPDSALTDKDKEKDLKNAVLTCGLCQRRVGLWAFMQNSVNGNGSAAPQATSATNGTGNGSANPEAMSLSDAGSVSTSIFTPPSQIRLFDVLKEHRPYCPYVVKSTPVPMLPSLASISTNHATQANTSPFAIPSPATLSTSSLPGKKPTQEPPPLVEGWRAMLNVVSRAGMGMRRRRAIASEGGVRPLVGSNSDLGGMHEEVPGDEMEEDVVDVDALVDSVKKGTGGSKEILKYVKNLLG